jgi:hypothetical protein
MFATFFDVRVIFFYDLAGTPDERLLPEED